MTSLGLQLADWTRSSEALLRASLGHPTPFTLALVFAGGLLTSLGPCSLSLLPVTLAYLAGFSGPAPLPSAAIAAPSLPWQRSLSFSAGIVASLVVLGFSSSLLGRLYGQIPQGVSLVVALLAVLMGLHLLGLVPLRLPAGPDPERWRQRVPAPLAPLAAGLAFGLAATPCTTPVLAVLLAWMAQNGRPLVGMLLLTAFGAGQVLPLLLAGTMAASLPSLLRLRALGRWIPPISGVVLLTTGALTLVAGLA
ncbi:MAG: cytochrome c biogenesis protein CcdA [Cyanobacteriota bacterium]|nr:cytochrome c biogenesis protein CcdA [Cyanobacteriota bacterium]